MVAVVVGIAVVVDSGVVDQKLLELLLLLPPPPLLQLPLLQLPPVLLFSWFVFFCS